MKLEKIASRVTLGVVVVASLSLAAPALAHHQEGHGGGRPAGDPTTAPPTTAPPTSPEPTESPNTIPTVPPLPTVPVPDGNVDPNCIGDALDAAQPLRIIEGSLRPFAPLNGAVMLVFCVI